MVSNNDLVQNSFADCTHFSKRFFQLWKHARKFSLGMDFSVVTFCIIPCWVSMRVPFSAICNYKNIQKLHGSVYGEQGACRIRTMLCLAKKVRIMFEESAAFISKSLVKMECAESIPILTSSASSRKVMVLYYQGVCFANYYFIVITCVFKTIVLLLNSRTTHSIILKKLLYFPNSFN